LKEKLTQQLVNLILFFIEIVGIKFNSAFAHIYFVYIIPFHPLQKGYAGKSKKIVFFGCFSPLFFLRGRKLFISFTPLPPPLGGV
jgi:hypothetical protein